MANKSQSIDQSFNNTTDFTSNAVKLLPKVENWNSWIKLYTEVNSNIKTGDKVVISWYNFGFILSGLTLDNYYAYSGCTDYPYTQHAQNYNVLYADNTANVVVIDKKFSDVSSSSGGTYYDFYDHYISKTSLLNIIYYSGRTDGTIFRQSTISTNNNEQSIILSSITYNYVIEDKYFYKYVSLNAQLLDRSYDSLGGLTPSATKATMNDVVYNYSFNNNTYGYNIIKDCNIATSIENGYFINCTISSSYNTTIQYYINNGYFENCNIDGYDIYGGYFKNCIIFSGETNGHWYYGNWDSTGETFFIDTWYDGSWNNGYRSTPLLWKNGTFNNGEITGVTWENGVFNNGIMYNSNWYNGSFNNGYIYNVVWSGGTFNNGTMTYIGPTWNEWYSGTFNNGYAQRTNFYNVIANNGEFVSNTFKDSTLGYTNIVLNNGHFINVIISGASMYNGLMNDSVWNNGKLYGGIITNSDWYFGEVFNGTISNSSWYDGIFNNGNFDNSNWYSGTFNNGVANDSYFVNCTWNNGTFNRGSFGVSGSSFANWYNGSFNYGIFASSIVLSGVCGLSSFAAILFYGLEILAYSAITQFVVSGQSETLSVFSPTDTITIYLPPVMNLNGWETILSPGNVLIFVKPPYPSWLSNGIYNFVFPNFNVNWYYGNFYKDNFNGVWYGGNWNGGTWNGWNAITNSTTIPSQQLNQYDTQNIQPYTPTFVNSSTSFSPQLSSRDYNS
jgi:hypothetical protein